MFYRIASAPILGVYQFSGKFYKKASFTKIAEQDDASIKKSINLISAHTLKSLAKFYNISSKIDDYIFAIPRAVTANVPNGNADRFTHEELSRFSPMHHCQVFETFRNDPLHVEHASEDPKTARGFLPDVHYSRSTPKDWYVLAVAAVDMTKDEPLAKGIMSGEMDKFSMGCVCEAVRCSYSKCDHPLAYSDEEMCEHLRHYRGSSFNGEFIFEDCEGVEFRELSSVGIPADPTAVTQMILKIAAKQQRQLATAKSRIPLIGSLLGEQDSLVVARYFSENFGKLPGAMVNLAERLF